MIRRLSDGTKSSGCGLGKLVDVLDNVGMVAMGGQLILKAARVGPRDSSANRGACTADTPHSSEPGRRHPADIPSLGVAAGDTVVRIVCDYRFIALDRHAQGQSWGDGTNWLLASRNKPVPSAASCRADPWRMGLKSAWIPGTSAY